MNEWNTYRVKDVAKFISEKANDCSLPYIALDNIVSWDGYYIPSDSTSDGNSNVCKKGDVLFGKLRPYLAKGYIPKQDSICSPEFIVLRPNDLINNSFLLYYLLSCSFISYIRNQVTGVKMPRTNALQIGRVSFALPSIEEQELIVSYLDKECDKITREINLLEQKVDCYSRLLRSLIIETVTSKKLSIKYREYRLKDIFELRNGYTPSKVVSEYWEGGTIPWFRMEDIRKNGRILSDSIQHITQEAIKTAGLFEANSFILSTTATIGEHALIIVDSLANQRFTNFKIRKSLRNMIDIKWMFYKFFNIDEYCKMGCKVTTFASVDMVELSNMVIFLPPIDEQLKMASYLDEKCSKIDAIIEKIKLRIERLKELKLSLINEVITGQRTIKTSDL